MDFDISRVYEKGNAEELKFGDKVFLADSIKELYRQVENDCGKVFEIRKIESSEYACRFKTETGEIAAFAYLVEKAEEKKWRPFKDIDELITAWQKKTGVTARVNTMPLIWVRNKESKCIGSISSFGVIDVFIFGCWKYMDYLFDEYEFLDGSPCGVKE